ncbi:lysophospholipid acyltransferase family protein [Pinibacter aurantiacus]|uniref:Lysophospholipid acyltransferase family protein n=1 Tax=Pinibacter aurantiacus TaxID=2851599 RepID=A0A9E2S971_9BACT|nr:lysophospholipid acyltransferase family protein [Pinibacter aurantiacus]MBV4356240.1 lysophospholipid acyltransferase family protein [Pinibacter aurantiacus]
MYYLLYGVLYLLSLLPMRVLYIFCDLIYVILYYIAGYRKQVVMKNLSIAFPEKSEAEKKTIARKFYRNFIDNFIEAIKMLSAGKSFVEKRYKGNFEIFEQINAKGKSAHLFLGHYFNWELGNFTLEYNSPLHMLIVYMPIKNQAMERLFIHLRQRSGAGLIPATPTSAFTRAYIEQRKRPYMLALLADQNPGGVDKAYWLNFFDRATPFVTGPEKSSRSANMPAVFGYFKKPKRGYYTLHFEMIEENPRSVEEGELTRRYVTLLENAIRENPEIWMWTHKRWKSEWKSEYKKLWIGKDVPVLRRAAYE